MKIIYLHPKSTFRTELRSDTLWGTICWAIRSVYGNSELEKTFASFNNNDPEFTISSAFPYKVQNKKKVLFFPKPILRDEYIDQTNLPRKERIVKSQNRKKSKGIQYIDDLHYQRIISGNAKLQDVLSSLISNEDSLRCHGLLSESVTHNTIDRIKGGSLMLEDGGQLFHVDEFYFDPDEEENDQSGLFFLAKGDTGKLEGALRLLEHIGIGGDRNIGKGHFKVKIDDYYLNEPEDFNAITNLSLYIPHDEELKVFNRNSLFSYQLEERQGYMSFFKHKYFDKPASIMFKEGSVFPRIEKNMFGWNPVIKPQSDTQSFNVYQYGIGFMIKMKVNLS